MSAAGSRSPGPGGRLRGSGEAEGREWVETRPPYPSVAVGTSPLLPAASSGSARPWWGGKPEGGGSSALGLPPARCRALFPVRPRTRQSSWQEALLRGTAASLCPGCLVDPTLGDGGRRQIQSLFNRSSRSPRCIHTPGSKQECWEGPNRRLPSDGLSGNVVLLP